MTDAPVVLVLAKAPVAGAVKTRLCPPLSPAQAADLAAAALLDSLAAAAAVPGATAVAVLTGHVARAARAGELATALRRGPVLAQRGDGLGPRIAAAHLDAAALFPDRATLQIGMDTPQAGPLLVSAAALLHAGRAGAVDAVLGLATDGGWWALGLRDPATATLVAEVPTSRADTGARTLAALRAGGLRVALLAELTDVDTAADAAAVAAAAPHTRFAAAVRALPVGALAPVAGLAG